MWIRQAIACTLMALLLAGCAGKPRSPEPPTISEPVPDPAPLPASPPSDGPKPAPPVQAGQPTVAREGSSLRIAGMANPGHVLWAPSGKTALIEASPGWYRLRLDPLELQALPELGSFQSLGWAGPDELLLVKWSSSPTIGQVSLASGEWQPLAQVRGQTAVCQSGESWVWVDIQEVRQGGAGGREIGPVHRTPAPKLGGTVEQLGGKVVLERGALLGRLADGSCLLDGLDRRLLLLRPNGELQTLTDTFSLPEVTQDGRGVVWFEKPGECPDCIELGPGMPFQRLHWWRLDGKSLTADLGTPQSMFYLLSPEGDRLLIGHWNGKSSGAISTLGPQGLQLGQPRTPAWMPSGWMGDDLFAQSADPYQWQYGAPLYRVSNGKQVGDWLTSGVGGGVLVRVDGEVRYLTPQGKAYRLSNPEPFLQPGQGIHSLGVYQPEARYLAARQDDGFLLVRLEEP